MVSRGLIPQESREDDDMLDVLDCAAS
jgi:hypothetical protein